MSTSDTPIPEQNKNLPTNWGWRAHISPEKAVLEVPVSSKAPAWWNFVLTRLLRSRIHYWRSDKDMLLTFTGRKSGKIYTVPVSYLRDGNTINCITKVPWWKNLSGNVPVTVRVQGKDLQGIAETITDDKETIARTITELLLRAPIGAKYYGVHLGPNGEPTPEEVMKAAQFTVLIRIQLSEPFV